MSVCLLLIFQSDHLFLMLGFESSLSILDILGWICSLQVFSPLCNLFFHSLNIGFLIKQVFNFDKVQFIEFFLLWIVLLMSCLRTFHEALSPEDYLLCFSVKVLIVLH